MPNLKPCAVLLAVVLSATAVAGVYYYDTSLDFQDSDINLARGKRANQTSYRTGLPANHSGYAVDGSRDLHQGCIATMDQANASWTVDLGAVSNLTYVKIYNYNDDNWWNQNLGKSSGGFDIWVSATGVETSYTKTKGYNYEGTLDERRWMYGAVTLFRVDAKAARYVKIQRRDYGALRLCEVEIFNVEPSMAYVVPEGVTQAAISNTPVSCPPVGHPLRDACLSNLAGGQKGNAAMALVKASMEGPINCGGKGFFCRMKSDPYFSGTPGDQLYNNYNFGYCQDAESDNPDNMFPGNYHDPEKDDGHCHGSHLDSVYQDVLQDHYHRVYRGTLECCCGESVTPLQAGTTNPVSPSAWVPATKLIERCDFRGTAGNNGTFNFEGGCGKDVNYGPGSYAPELFVSPQQYKSDHMCWELKHFGRMPDFKETANPLQVNTLTPLAQPPFPKPTLELMHCTGDAQNWEGCLIYVEGRQNADVVVLVSASKSTEPRTIRQMDFWNDVPYSCHDVDGVFVTGDRLQWFYYRGLDDNGEEVDFVRVTPNYEPGTEVHIQVVDTETCMLSDVKSGVLEVSSPPSQGGSNRRLLAA